MTIKEKLIREIEASEDELFLSELYALISDKHALIQENKFSEAELSELNEAYEIYQRNDTLTDEQAKSVFELWKKEKSDGQL